MAQVAATYDVDIDSDADELFESGEAVEGDVLARRGLRYSRGRDQIRDVAPPKAGRCNFVLRNDSGTYDVGGAIDDGDPVRVRATDPTTSTVHDLWTGIIERVRQDPNPRRQQTAIEALGTLSRLAGGRRGLSTALFENITIDVAIGHLLDAAGWPKNLDAYAATLGTLAGDWRLGESSGDALDSTANGNDGTVTLGAGTRAEPALDDGGDGSIECDGANTNIAIPAHASINGAFDDGGSLFFMCNAQSDGEGNQGRIAEKTRWAVFPREESGGFVKLRFTHSFDGGTDGQWTTTERIVPINTDVFGLVVYDNSHVDNDPTLYLWTGTTFSILTNGDGLSIGSRPVGTRRSDASYGLNIGGIGTAVVFDGHIDGVKLWTDGQRTAAEAKGLVARALNAPRHLDTAKLTLESWWLDEGERVMRALNDLLYTEGPGAAIYEDGTGAIVFKNRHARVTESRSTAIQTTFTGTTTEPVVDGRRLIHDNGRAGVINGASMTRRGRTAASSAAIWRLGENVTLAPNETKKLTIRQSDRKPFKTALNPAVTTDYTVDAGAVSSITLDRDSGSSAVLTIVAGVNGVTLSALQVRAQSWDVDGTGDGTIVEDTVEAAASITKYGERRLPTRITPRAEISLIDMQDLMNAYVGFHETARPTVEWDVVGNRDGDAMTPCLAREISDRVRVNVTQSAIDLNLHIEQIAHTITGGPLHVARLGAEKATSAQALILDTSLLDGSDLLWF